MTPANVKRFKELGEMLISLSKENPKADTGLYMILKAITTLTSIATDLHFRPEANS